MALLDSFQASDGRFTYTKDNNRPDEWNVRCNRCNASNAGKLEECDMWLKKHKCPAA